VKTYRLLLGNFCLWCALLPPSLYAESYPSRAVTLIVPFSAGGPTDVVARVIAAPMSKLLGQSVIVESKPGAGGTIGTTYAAKARAGGYTFLLHHNGMATSTALYRKLPYNPLTDFEYVAQVVDVPMTIIGRKDFPPNNLGELITYLKMNADKVNLANAGPGAISHLCGMLLQNAINVQFTTIPYQGTGPALTALEGGHVDLLCDQTTQTLPHIQGKRVKLYGVTTAARIAALPTAPTLKEMGIKDFEIVVWHGIYAPRGTPKDAIDKFNAALRATLKDPNVVKRFTELGAQIVPEPKQTPSGLREWLKSEIAKWTPIIRAAGIYAD
jgi:tripartite-type tricarboxylate transporter receptor subunit TctC